MTLISIVANAASIASPSAPPSAETYGEDGMAEGLTPDARESPHLSRFEISWGMGYQSISDFLDFIAQHQSVANICIT